MSIKSKNITKLILSMTFIIFAQNRDSKLNTAKK